MAAAPGAGAPGSAPAPVVIVGAGQAGVQLADSLREAGYEGAVTLVGDEPGLPGQRPPLSKEFLSTDGLSRQDVALRAERFYAERDIRLVIGRRVVRIDRARHTVELDDSSILGYGHLVLATGTRPRPLPVPGADLDGVLPLRTVEDAERLRSRMRAARDVVVVGAGFIGLEVAAACRAAGLRPVVVDIAERAMGRAVSAATSEFFAERHRALGTRLILGGGVSELLGRDGRVTAVRTSDGATLPADLVVVGVGVLPNTALAEAAGLDTGDGIVVDARLATSDPDISAIGDCAAFPDPRTGRRIRLESVQNAADQARCLAARLTGIPRPYTAPPWFWSYQGPLKLQIAGLSTGHDLAVVRGAVEDGRFSVFCYRDRELIAVESVNRAADHMTARKLLALGRSPAPEEAADPSFDLKAFTTAPSSSASHSHSHSPEPVVH
ncbi:pyridine nucleotide-disulfide oxidoreductase [Streptomyces ipomoeae]|nr:pyridine nucleotide-disulfide oxidoreductase [Streptomyces ipomoeae]